MKNIQMFLAGLTLIFFSAEAQIANPVKWRAKIEKQTVNQYVLTFEATIEKGWHLYSQFTPDGGPAPLELSFPNGKSMFIPLGKATESATVTTYNKVFGVSETYFIEKAKIVQRIKIITRSSGLFQIKLAYQICKQVCVPQEVNFTFDIKSLQLREIYKTAR